MSLLMKKYELSHQKNIRDMGGLIGHNGRKIKSGRLFRGGALNKVNEEDALILEGMHLTDVVDFRSEEEFVIRPDYRLRGALYHSFPAIVERIKKEDRKEEDGNLLWFVGDDSTGYEHLKQQYRDLVTVSGSIEAYREFFKIVQQEGRVIYFHCSQGKDRAGLAAYLIEVALGVDFETRKEDYLLTNIAMESRVERIIQKIQDKPFYDAKYHQSLLDVFSAKLDYLNEAIKIMDERYGGALNYLRNVLGVDIERLRDLYLE